jgi:hypothetical protein
MTAPSGPMKIAQDKLRPRSAILGNPPLNIFSPPLRLRTSAREGQGRVSATNRIASNIRMVYYANRKYDCRGIAKGKRPFPLWVTIYKHL